jgi:pSer/pThr/pTyr-binding forkhead associated (FHA) protein
MAKLVVLSEGLTGRSYELKVDKTTIGRLDDNSFQIPEQSVSSHHCEVLLKGSDVVVKDLNSTNGTFINGEKVTEQVLKPGQVLRLGTIELRLESDAAQAQASKKQMDQQTRVIPRGVKLNEFEQGTGVKFDKNSPFAKKTNKTNMVFIIVGVILGCIILVLLAYAFLKMREPAA